MKRATWKRNLQEKEKQRPNKDDKDHSCLGAIIKKCKPIMCARDIGRVGQNHIYTV
jgi:hypothetical protein